jgi:hypothetical protein
MRNCARSALAEVVPAGAVKAEVKKTMVRLLDGKTATTGLVPAQGVLPLLDPVFNLPSAIVNLGHL